jgi:tetratricopeptide (TPR) repeat protein
MSSPRYRARLWIVLFLALRVPSIALAAAHPAPAADEFKIVDPDEDRKPDPAATKPARKYDTFAHHMLDIDAGETFVAPAKYALLDAIIDDAKARITYDATIKDPRAFRKQAMRILQTVDGVLTQYNVLYPPGECDVTSLRSGLAPQRLDHDTLDRFLEEGINARRREHARAHAAEPFYILDCDISSFVYVGIAQAIGFELHLVDLPDHMFVRWEFADGTHLNWDTNDAEEVSDRTFASDYGLGKRIRKKRVYLASMTTREAEGYAYFLRATRLEERDEDARAIADLEKARELYPQSTQAGSELAWLYATAEGVDERHRKQAVELAQSAVDLEPQCGDFWDSLAAAHAANGAYKQAVKDARKAESFAETDADRAEFKSHRKAFEKGAMPGRN